MSRPSKDFIKIEIGRDTAVSLKALGTMNDTYDSVIKRLLKEGDEVKV